MLANLFMYKVAVDYIEKRPKKYLEKFLDLMLRYQENQSIIKQCARIFYNIAKSSLPDVFDVIEKTAVKHAEEKKTMPF